MNQFKNRMHNKNYTVSKIKIYISYLIVTFTFMQGCISNNNSTVQSSDSTVVHLITLAPGHFHAALLQKSMDRLIDSTVYVFAPDGDEVKSHLSLIDSYNNRSKNPTGWIEKVYIGQDYLEKMLKSKSGNLVIIAGNNKMKTDYIKKSINAGLNVLSDKPLAITKADFGKLEIAFDDAKKNNVMLYDIMTGRYKISNILQKLFSQMPDVFGELQKGNLGNPAIIFQSTHYFLKEVSGEPLIRPTWYFDVDQEGEGIVDVTTHLVDLIQWECFPNISLDYENDIHMLTAKHWATVLTPSQFKRVTKSSYPDFLSKYLKADSLLNVYANGEMNYTIKGIHVRVSAFWNFESTQGIGDTYSSTLRGTKANLMIKQGKEQKFKPILYIEPSTSDKVVMNRWNMAVEKGLENIKRQYPGVDLKKSINGWEVVIPDKYKIDHEQQFSLVIKKFIQYLKEGKMPQWEVLGMVAKYYTTTQALEKALER